MINKQEYEAVCARCEAATPGPWIFENGYLLDISGYLSFKLDLLTPDNAEFIAHARQDIPALLNENFELRAIIDVKDAEIRRLKRQCAVWQTHA